MVTAKLQGWRFGVFEADLELHELRKRGIHIKLAGQPFQVLALLLQRPGEVVSREELRTVLWPGEPWGDHDQRLNKAVNKIRDALNDSADTPRLIETIPRIGYRFLGSVSPLTDGSSERGNGAKQEPDREIPPPPHSVTTPVTFPAPPTARQSWRVPPWIVAFALVVALASAIFYGNFRRSAPANRDRLVSAAQATPLTTYVGSEQYPSFSPDGKQIAFAWDGAAQGGLHLYLISVGGRNLRQITKGPFNDYAPVWSSDEMKLAFVRELAGHSNGHSKELWTAGADGSGQRKLAEFGLLSGDDHPVTWTKDARWLIAAARPPGDGPSALYVISTDTGERRRLTSPPMQSAGDLSPSVSPNGNLLAFTRGINIARRDIFVVPLTRDLSASGEPARVTEMQRIVDTLAWSADGRRLYFSASPTPSGARHIFRVGASGVNGGNPGRELVETGIEGIHPVISPDGDTLCYVRNNIEQTSIWRLDLPDEPPIPEPKRTLLLSSTRRDYTADLSPDGKQFVFSSVRSGASEIWVSDIDGSNLRQVTYKGASTPRWSPDGRRVAYESSVAGQPDIYVFDVRTNVERRLTSDPEADLRPSWSRDGKFVYFSSTRTGRSQIWKTPVEGGAAMQITRDGGLYAIETFDGKTIYYTSAGQPPSIRYAPANGGPERTLFENVVGHSAISLGRGGLYYLASRSFTGARIDFYSFATETSRPLVSINHPVHHFLSSSPDGGSVLFTQIDRQDTDLMLLRLK